jgi:hypothetical protein
MKNLRAPRTLGTLFLTGLMAMSMAAAPAPGASQDVRLIVVMSVDQLRGDLLERYEPVFTGGLARLLSQGSNFVNATHDHARTETAAGHVTLATGVYPSRHGVVGNSFSVRTETGEFRSVYCVADPESPLLGFPNMPGRSWENILRDGLPDWVQDRDPEAHIVSISRKDRSAVGMGGRSGGHAYWIVENAGVFTTSTRYRDRLPDWVAAFNSGPMMEMAGDSVWRATASPEARALSLPDTAEWEGDGVHTAFDHRAWEETDPSDPGRYGSWIARTPVGDRAVRLLGQEAITALGMGQSDRLDYLALGFSSADYIGHRYGPLSREQAENLLALDRELGEFFAFLDEEVGTGRWVLALSADHGVMDAPGSPAAVRRSTRDELLEYRETAAELRNSGLWDDALAAEASERLSGLAVIGGATPLSVLAGSEPVDSIVQLQRNGYFPGRYRSTLGSLGVEIFTAENVLLDTSARGTSHGSPWHYDRWVPLLFLGPGAPAGRLEDRAATVDMAPTLAGMAGLRVPGDLDGRDLLGGPR